MPADICGHTQSDREGECEVVRKWLPWLALALILWWIVTDPHGAAGFLKHAGASLATFASGL